MSTDSNVSVLSLSSTATTEFTVEMEDYWYTIITSTLGVVAIIGGSMNLATIVMISRNKRVKRCSIL